MSQQKLENPPRNKEEYNRQKGPVPMLAILISLGLIAAGALFFFNVAFPYFGE
ncbi:MAG: hypothetical protein ACLFR0_04620 [Alphaproteobacteria bacterium]